MANKPFGGLILNPSCKCKCVFCGVSPKKSLEEIRRQEINVYKNLQEFKSKGVKNIEISGSDPAEYDHIIPLIKYIKDMGFECVQLSTHGLTLADDKFLKDILESGLDKLRIPVYGSNADVHDSVTRLKGSFEATLKGIKGVLNSSSDIQVQISCLVLQQNKDDLLNLIDLMKNLGVPDFYIAAPFVSNGDYSYYVPYKDLGPYVKDAFDHALKIDQPIFFMEIPFCVFGKIDDRINNNSLPPDLGSNCQPPDQFKTSIKDLPSYRMKKKLDMCNSCQAHPFCDGFTINDISRFGYGSLKPIKD